MKQHNDDFGWTFGHCGVGSGVYSAIASFLSSPLIQIADDREPISQATAVIFGKFMRA
jgi:hypothetical protein